MSSFYQHTFTVLQTTISSASISVVIKGYHFGIPNFRNHMNQNSSLSSETTQTQNKNAQ